MRASFSALGTGSVQLGDSALIALEIALIVLSGAGFVLLDAYTRACGQI
jgi:hypothetical protein